MPFTLSHAAAALPFRRARLVPSALVIGTFAPDLEYFIRLVPGGGWGHTIAGAFGMDLPLGLVCLWLFHRWVKIPLAYLLPDSVRGRLTPLLAPFQFGPLRRFLHICASMLIGSATHIVWDGFTHPQYWGVRHVPFLLHYPRLPWLRLEPWCDVLQDFSTLAGFAVVIIFCFIWLRRSKPDDSIPRNPLRSAHRAAIALAGSAVAILGAILRVSLGIAIHENNFVRQEYIEQFVVTFGALVWWQLALWGLLGPFRHVQATAARSREYAQSGTFFE